MTNLTLALDVMGGDFGPRVTVPASLQALRFNPLLKMIFVGDTSQIEPFLSHLQAELRQRIQIVHTTEVVSMSDRPVYALRHRKQSSMRLALELVRDGQAQACLSAGNTGALMAMAKVILKTLSGVDRPALVSCLPAINNKPVYLLDLGANVSSDAQNLFEFAVMGSVLTETVHKTSQPRVALLNVGIEEIKGNEHVKHAGKLLQKSSQINYVGFIEGDEIYSGNVDVIVCDGFVGNITLKTSEGIARLLIHQLKKSLSTNILTKILAKILSPCIHSLLDHMNPDHYNGASLIGLRSVVVKSHGSADEAAFLQAINLALTEAQRRLPSKIEQRLESILLDTNS